MAKGNIGGKRPAFGTPARKAQQRAAYAASNSLPANLVMIFGDSRAVGLSTSSAVDSRIDSRLSGRSPLAWWRFLYGTRADIGAAGQGAAITTTYIAQWPTVRAQRPRVVIFLGVVNDANTDVPAGASPAAYADGTVAASWFNRLQPLAEEVRSWGGVPVFCTEPLGEGVNQEARIVVAAQYDALCAAYASARGLPICDIKSAMRDASSTSTTIVYKTGYSWDSPGLHAGDYGARKIAEVAFAPVLNAIFTLAEDRSTAVDAVTVNQLVTNPWLSTATGGTANSGVTGPVPLGHTVELSGAAGTKTATVSTEARGDGKGNNLVLTLTSDAAGQIVRDRTDITAALQTSIAFYGGAAVKVRFIAEIDVTDADPLATAYGLIQATVNGTAIPTIASDLEVYSSTTSNQRTAYKGRIKTPFYTIPAGATVAAVQARLFAVSGGAGVTVAKFGVLQVQALLA